MSRIGMANKQRSPCTAIEAELSTLREQVQQLQASLEEIRTRSKPPNVVTASDDQQSSDVQGPRRQLARSRTDSRRSNAPTRAQFLGPTSSDYSFNVANSTLHSLGIRSDYDSARLESAFTSRRESLEPSSQEVLHPRDPLLSLGLTEIYRTLEIYKEELHSIYPFIMVDDVIAQARVLYQELEKLHNVRLGTENIDDIAVAIGFDISILKMMVATAVVVEGAEQSEVGQKLLHSVEVTLSRSMKEIRIDLKQLQIFTLTVGSLISSLYRLV